MEEQNESIPAPLTAGVNGVLAALEPIRQLKMKRSSNQT